MNNLQQDFLQRSIANLENLTESANKEKNLSPESLREIFRTLHTIKGTAQTFGFAASARLAHELENLLSAADFSDSSVKDVLLEGFALLIKSFGQAENFDIPASFLPKIRELAPDSAPESDYFSTQIPDEIARQLSEYEKTVFVSAIRGGQNIFCVQADFDFADFSVQFKKLRENLSVNGEIIATLPNPGSAAKNKIGFLIYFAGREGEAFADFPIEIVRQTTSFAGDSEGILAQTAAHGKDLAQKLGKKVEFTVSNDKIELSDENLKLIFDILLHLVRNAIDHAIEKPSERRAKGKDAIGKIEISLKTSECGLAIAVKDDGKGIDLEKIMTKAIEKNLLAAGKILTESEITALIFLPEFSSRETVSEISGRGIGLDAVKNLIENAGGKISVETVKDAGTTFEIFLPKEF